MAGFVSLDDLINEITTNSKRDQQGFYKVGVTGHAGSWQSVFRLAGVPGAGADGAAGSGTPGAGGSTLTALGLNFHNCTPDFRVLLNIMATATQNATLMVYDRLTHTSGISTASTGSKNVGSPNPPRYNSTTSTDPDYIAGNECWLEVTTVTNTTAPVMHLLTYTNQAGTTGRVGGNITFPAAATVVGTFIGPMPLQVGDSGVRSVETVNVDTASASTGAVQVVVLRPLAYIPIIQNIANVMNFVTQLPSLPRLFDGHSLSFAILMPATTATTIYGEIVAGFG